MNNSKLSLYSVWDDQFKLYSDPFLAADDNAAERTLVQTAILSDGFRKRLCFHSLHCLGSFDPTLKRPASVLKRPRLVSGSVRLMDLVDAIERKQKEHLSTVSAPPDSYVFEKAKDKVDGDAFLKKHCADDFPDLAEREDSTCE